MNRSPEITGFWSVVGSNLIKVSKKCNFNPEFKVANHFRHCNTSLELAILIGLPENGQKIFWVGGFSHGSVGLQETTILFCPGLSIFETYTCMSCGGPGCSTIKTDDAGLVYMVCTTWIFGLGDQVVYIWIPRHLDCVVLWGNPWK